ncbi:hypothetical protein EI42_00623 [Thermosporothrix hazakensis]|jgi:Sec-independent protein translocase protein TatA|uniref:Sec-independent protein translocase protein TatA n=2 Tax=Thermosporothrix TaxID=768650 RepID=A0A326UR07_THEHA|nr:hypothetical protein [Thermosporothrix hazakensis]PZW36449.1 hypothetical protein EI42_00623 [Thermosporothrix hazakensis]BBH88917.1 hypothetical protein KTC_36680 [Thermosporothrix sp. COM3]GCE47103.1 hypothetical protein KTH_19720 [Thermosporothrix hazakensis]
MHYLNLAILILLLLAVFGPKHLVKMGKGAGKVVGEAKVMKDKLMADLKVDDIVGDLRDVPTSPRDVARKLLLDSPKDTKEQDVKVAKAE